MIYSTTFSLTPRLGCCENGVIPKMPPEKRNVGSKRHTEAKERGKRTSQSKGDASHDREQQDSQSDSANKPRSTGRRLLIRLSTIAALLLGAHLYFGRGDSFKPFARQTESVSAKFAHIRCSDDYKEDRTRFPECAPVRCGRSVMDDIISKEEAQWLLKIAKRGLSLGGSNGGASILDLHSGALSKGDSFMNIYKYLEHKKVDDVFSSQDFKLYRRVADKIKVAISARFQIPQKELHLTQPTFFSRMTNKKAQTVHDEYWHSHVDKQTYETFDYTSLLYLSDYGIDFQGGRFVFIDPQGNSTVEPKLGRLSFFTSGSENTHYVEKVMSGTRYAITVSFTCDKSHAIKYPTLGT